LKLNSEQRKAILHEKGPAIVIAGAGTGKTRVVTERIVYLIKKRKVKPEEILAVTFTEKAAGEMLDRVDRMLPYGYGDLWILTFHGLCDRILRESSLHIGINPGYELMGYPEQLAFLRKHLFKEFKLSYFRPLNNPYKFIDALIKYVSRLQDEDVSPEEFLAFAKSKQSKLSSGDEAEKIEEEKILELANFYIDYQRLKLKNNKLDFGDLLFYTLDLFRKRPNVLKEYQKRFKYVMVDEFQDTNYIQNEIAMLLSEPENNIMVVGDDDQAIYRFRGASVSNILQFQEKFPDAKVITLNKNYRSLQDILDGAYKVIKNNNPYRLEVKARVNKKLQSMIDKKRRSEKSRNKGRSLELFPEDVKRKDSAVEVYRFSRDFDEADFIAQKIMQLSGASPTSHKKKNEKIDLENIAVLVRAHDHLTQIVQRLRFYGIPYQFGGTTDLFSRPVVKDIMALLRVVKDPTDDVSMYRVLTFSCFELTSKSLIDLTNRAGYLGIPLYSLVNRFIAEECDDVTQKDMKIRYGSRDNFLENNGINNQKANDLEKKSGERFDNMISKEGLIRLKSFFNYVDKAREKMVRYHGISNELFNLLKQIDFISYLEEKKRDADSIASLYELLTVIQQFEYEGPFTLSETVEYLENLEALGGVEQREVESFPRRGVQLMTIHGAKGLEFDAVIIPCLVNGRFPSRSREDPISIPDEVIKEILPEGDEKIQEERRLFYVGMTRAKKKVVLTFSDYYADGKQLRQPSIFLYELFGEKVRDLPYEERVENLGEEETLSVEIVKEDFSPSLNVVSVSQLNEYKKCPKQYYFKYILKLKTPPSATMSFGNTIHATLKKFFDLQRRYILGGISSPPTLEDLLKIYEENWIGAGYRNLIYEKNRKKIGMKALETFYKQFYLPDSFPIKLEEPFRIKIGDITLLGRIDRIDMIDREKRFVRIIDYKTGGDKEALSAEEKMQLVVYGWAVKEHFGWMPKALSIVRVEEGKELNVEWEDSLVDKAKKFVLNTVEEIGKKGFFAKPGFQCQYCDYRNICNWAKR